MKCISTFKRSLLAFGLLGLFGSLLTPFGGKIGFESGVSANAFIPSAAIEGTVFAITAGNNLISFNQFAPNAIIKTSAITGLQSGENILGIDFRPRTGALYAVSSQSRVYIINTATGAATAAGAAPFTPAVAGASFGVDFNPVPDRIRFVSDQEQNLRLNPNDGTTAGTDGTLAYAMGDANVGQNPNVVAAAYTNNFSGATTTSLYVIDSARDILALQGSAGGTPVSPNTGQLFTVGALGVDTGDQVGFDIVSPSGLALASLTPAGATASSFYSINLQTGAATLIGQIGGTEVIRDIAAVVRVETIYAIDTNNALLAFNSGTPGTIASTQPVTGLATGENILGIDFRPATGDLYAVSSQSRVYTINTTTGAASAVGAAPFTPPVTGVSFGVDFNPVPDRIRLVSDADQNLRLNPNNGAVAGTDTNLAFATGDANASANPSIVASAYTNNVAGATTTTLYGIDFQLNALVLQGSVGGTPTSPNTGQLTTVGALGVDPGADVGFDIVPLTNAAFASMVLPGATTSTLFTINLAMGTATPIGAIGGSAAIRDIAVAVHVETVFAVTASNKLLRFAATAPGVILGTAQITGLMAGDLINGLDFRPANMQLYALSTSSRIYVINPVTGVATPVGATTNPGVADNGIGFDFNPVPDRIRVVSPSTQNLRFNPVDGTTSGTDMTLAFATGDPNAGQRPNVAAAAYNNNFAGSTSTTLYVIDSNFDALLRQGSPGGMPVSPNTGQLFTVGRLAVDSTEQIGFDIADCTNNAYASLTVGGVSQLHSINLQTGAATLVGNIAGGEIVRGIAIGNTGPASAQPGSAATTNAASFAQDAFAPSSLAAVFGRFQTTGGQTFSATSTPLPVSLGGVNVKVNNLDAGLLLASNGQINLALPQQLTDGPATLLVVNADGSSRTGTINIRRTATGIFTFFSNGMGTPAAVTTTNGTVFLAVFNPDGSPAPLSAGTAAAPNFLVLFTTGLRNVPAANPNDQNGVAESVTAMVGTANATVSFAGPAPGLVGVDQVNLIIPPQLAGAGVVNVRLTAGTFASNTVSIRIQ
ncbi:MAG: DUF4394 domain-containing protein [Blastocatellia bacterium]